jgi:hypothetical protein
MKFWSGIMQGFKFAWRFKCFTISFHPKMFYKDSIYDTSFFLNMNSKRNYKNLNQQIVINFWMTRFWSYFQKFIFQSFFCCEIKHVNKNQGCFLTYDCLFWNIFKNILGIICLTLCIWIKVSKSSTSFTREYISNMQLKIYYIFVHMYIPK